MVSNIEEASVSRIRGIKVFDGVPEFEGERAVLFDSKWEDKGKMPDDVLLTLLTASCEDYVKEGVDLLLYIGDLSMPALAIDLAELVRKGGRPINLRVRRTDEVLIAT
jgi:hypothetical protein